MQAPNTQHIHLYDTRGGHGPGRLLARFAPWVVTLGSLIQSPVAFAGGRVVLGCADGRLVGLGEHDAVESAERNIDGGGVKLAPVEVDGVVVVASASGRIHGLSSDGLRQLWTTRLALGDLQAPVVVNGRVVFGSHLGQLHALDPRTGKEAWVGAVGGGRPSRAAVCGEVVCAATTLGELVGLEAATGAARWRLPALGTSSWVFGVGEAVVEVSGDAVRGVEGASGRPRWSATAAGSMVAVEPGDGVVFTATTTGELEAWAVEDGTRLWRTSVGRCEQGRIVVDGDVVVLKRRVAARDGSGVGEVAELVALDRVTGHAVWHEATTDDGEVAGSRSGQVFVAEGRVLRAWVASTGTPVWIGDGDDTVAVESPRRVVQPTLWRRLVASSASLGALMSVILGVILLKAILVDVLDYHVFSFLSATAAADAGVGMSFLIAAGLFVAAVVYTGWRVASVRREHRLLSHGIAVVADIVAEEGRPSQLVHYRYFDHRNRPRVGADLADDLTRPPWAHPGTKVCVLVDPAAPERSIVPALHEVAFDERSGSGVRALPVDLEAGEEPRDGVVALREEGGEGVRGWRLWRRAAPGEVGAIRLEGNRLTAVIAGESPVEFDGGRAMAVQVSVWPVSFTEAEVAVVVRAVGASASAPSLRFKTILPQSELRTSLPLKQERCPHVARADFLALWRWLVFHGRVVGVEAPSLARRVVVVEGPVVEAVEAPAQTRR